MPFLKFELSASGESPLLIIMAVWRTSNFKKNVPNGRYYLQRSVTPDQITQQNSLPRAVSKSTLRPDFQVNTRPSIFLKAHITTRYRKEVVKRNPGIVT
jgi:hypothetical protein